MDQVKAARQAAQVLAWAALVVLGAVAMLWAICGPLGDAVTGPCPSNGRLPTCPPSWPRY